MTAPVPADDIALEPPRDLSLPPFGDFIAALADLEDEDGEDGGDGDDDPFAAARARIVDIERITLSLSIEVEVTVDGSGGVAVRGSTPTQYTETTIMPPFHRLALHVGADPDVAIHGEG